MVVPNYITWWKNMGILAVCGSMGGMSTGCHRCILCDLQGMACAVFG